MSEIKNKTKAPDFEDDASIVIKFSIPDEEGNVQTSVEAKGMTIQHFKHLVSVANWYVENEFQQKEQDAIKNIISDTVENIISDNQK